MLLLIQRCFFRMSDRSRWRPPVPDENTAGVSIEIQEVEEDSIESLANNGNIQLDR